MDESLFYTCVDRMRRMIDDPFVRAFIDNVCDHRNVGPLADNEMIAVVNGLSNKEIRLLMMLSLADELSAQIHTD